MHKIGILGAADIAPRSIIQPARRRSDTVIHAVASRRPGAAQAYADTHRIPVSCGSYDALLADPDITIVDRVRQTRRFTYSLGWRTLGDPKLPG